MFAESVTRNVVQCSLRLSVSKGNKSNRKKILVLFLSLVEQNTTTSTQNNRRLRVQETDSILVFEVEVPGRPNCRKSSLCARKNYTHKTKLPLSWRHTLPLCDASVSWDFCNKKSGGNVVLFCKRAKHKISSFPTRKDSDKFRSNRLPQGGDGTTDRHVFSQVSQPRSLAFRENDWGAQ